MPGTPGSITSEILGQLSATSTSGLGTRGDTPAAAPSTYGEDGDASYSIITGAGGDGAGPTGEDGDLPAGPLHGPLGSLALEPLALHLRALADLRLAGRINSPSLKRLVSIMLRHALQWRVAAGAGAGAGAAPPALVGLLEADRLLAAMAAGDGARPLPRAAPEPGDAPGGSPGAGKPAEDGPEEAASRSGYHPAVVTRGQAALVARVAQLRARSGATLPMPSDALEGAAAPVVAAAAAASAPGGHSEAILLRGVPLLDLDQLAGQLGLLVVRDEGALQQAVAAVLAAHPDTVADSRRRYAEYLALEQAREAAAAAKAGPGGGTSPPRKPYRCRLEAWLVGQVMKQLAGRADSAEVSRCIHQGIWPEGRA